MEKSDVMNGIDMQQSLPVQQVMQRPWKRALSWLLFLGPLFFISYGFANWLASQHSEVAHIVFAWEQYIPFVPWTIIPYWVIDGLYVISLFICVSKTELDSHAKRLLTAQLIAVICFIVAPMGFSFERPPTDGFIGGLFEILSSFDQPYNQAPSLHIALLVILWVLFVKHIPRRFAWLLHSLCVLIAISVLTTYQHHFIDVPSGALLGLFSVWLWPEDGRNMFNFKPLKVSKPRFRLSLYYFSTAIILSIIAVIYGGVALWLIWPAVSLALLGLIYLCVGTRGFQKDAEGKMSFVVKSLLLPYLTGAKVNSCLWTRNDNAADHISDGVHLGRFPSRREIKQEKYLNIIDMTAEFSSINTKANWRCVPCLDLIELEKDNIVKAITLIEESLSTGSVLVCCALGYSRSAAVVIAWLFISGRADNLQAAIQLVRSKRPAIVINDADIKILEELSLDGAYYEK